MRALVIQLRQLGDILLTTPAVHALRDSGAEVDVLTHAMGRLIFRGNPDLSKHFTYREDDSLRQSWQLLRDLRARHYDYVFDFMDNPRSALTSLLLMGRRRTRVGWSSARRGAYNVAVPKLTESDYIVREKFALLRAVGIEAKSERLVLPWFEQDLGPAKHFLGGLDRQDGAPLVALSATHRRPRRKWPEDRYVDLARRLIDEWGAYVVWLWGPGEQDEVAKLAKNCASDRSLLSPATTFAELAALIAHCDLFVGNSNGPSHVAVAVDTPSLQLHGHTDMRSWCPLNMRHQALQSSEFGRRDASLNSIALEDVWVKLAALRASNKICET